MVRFPLRLAGREKPILVPIDSIFQALSRENVIKIHKNVFETGPNTKNLLKCHLTGPVSLPLPPILTIYGKGVMS